MHLAFAAWNGDIQAAREEYDAIRAAEQTAVTQCPKGLHDMVSGNLIRRRGRPSKCRACHNDYMRQWHRDRRAREKAA
jgi:hypothetical protein